MSTPDGWYPSPKDPGQEEYWNGTRWTGVTRASEVAPPVPTEVVQYDLSQYDQPAAAPQPASSFIPKLPRSMWIGIGITAIWLLVALVSNGIGGALVAAGTIAFGTALFTLITGRKSWLRLPSRKVGALLLAGAVVASFVGTAVNPPAPKTAVISLADTAKKATTTTKDVVEQEEIPFQTIAAEDPASPAGTVTTTTAGVVGTRTVTYLVTLTDGKETSRKAIKEETAPPVNEVITTGTYVAPAAPAPFVAPSECNANYDGCVPNASDVDCAGGDGDGPAYLEGTATVIGSDVYKLDRDKNGVACD